MRKGFSDFEKEAIKDRLSELNDKKIDKEKVLLEKIDEMPEADRLMAKRIHELVRENAPDLSPRLWYGMPAYARDEKVICFFQSAGRFKSRYATLGFSDRANLDDGPIWATSFALTQLSPMVEKKIARLLKKAID